MSFRTEYKRKWKYCVINPTLFIIGLLMGMADLVPGVSGGTIALLAGIYRRFLLSLSRLKLFIFYWRQSGFWFAWLRCDIRFLSSLALGVLLAVFLLSKLFHFLMHDFSLEFFSFFYGLVISASFFFGAEIIQRHSWSFLKQNFSAWMSLGCGFFLGLVLFFLPFFNGGVQSAYYLVFGSFMAVFAMILPGVSGSYILLLLGLYETVVAALASLDWSQIGLILLGLLLGFFILPSLIYRLLKRFPFCHLFFLGLVIGSSLSVYPTDSLALNRLVLFKSLGFVLLGFIFVFYLERLRKRILLR